MKKKSFDIVLRISDLENALGSDNAKIIKLKQSFSKLQSAVNYAVYYRKNKNTKESDVHMKYAFTMAEYLYKILETVEIPKAEVELGGFKKPKEKTKGSRFKIKLNYKHLLILLLFGLAYVFIMWWFFIR